MPDITPSNPPAVRDWDISLSPWAARLNAMDGEYKLAMEIGERRAAKEKEWDIARHYGVRRGQLRMWLKAVPGRWEAFCAAYEALADERVEESIDIADAATVDDVAVAGLRVKVRQWYAERAGRSRWGAKDGGMSVQAVGNITIIHESA